MRNNNGFIELSILQQTTVTFVKYQTSYIFVSLFCIKRLLMYFLVPRVNNNIISENDWF